MSGIKRDFAFPSSCRGLDGDVDDLPRRAPISPDGFVVGIEAGGERDGLILPGGRGEYGTGIFVSTTPDPDVLLVCVLGDAY